MTLPISLPQVVPHHAQVVVRLTDAQVVEEDLVELVVVVLAGVDDGEVEVLIGLADHLGKLDDLRARAHDDHEFELAHILDHLIVGVQVPVGADPIGHLAHLLRVGLGTIGRLKVGTHKRLVQLEARVGHYLHGAAA